MRPSFADNSTDCFSSNGKELLPASLPEDWATFAGNCTQGGAFAEEIEANQVSPELPSYLKTTATIVCFIVLALGTAGNLLVPLVVLRTKELRNSTNYFLINLSIADLLILIVCMPTVLIELHSQPEVWLLGEGMCKAVPFVELAVAHGSVLTILAISFERYYAICKPLKAGYTCTRRRAVFIIIVIWVTAFSATLPVLTFSEHTYAEYIDGTILPVCLTLVQTVWQKTYFLTMLALFFAIPLVVLIILYGLIMKHLVMDGRAVSSNSEQTQQIRLRRQVVMMLAAVVVIFFLCLLPFRIFTLWIIVSPIEKLHELGVESYYNLLYFCRIMLYLNSAVNPLLYNAISSKFRKGFCRLFAWKGHHKFLRHVAVNATLTSVTLQSSLKSRSSQSGVLQVVIPISRVGSLRHDML